MAVAFGGGDLLAGPLTDELADDLTGEIRGMTWLDLNGNGQRDADDLPVEGWTIYSDQNQNGRWDAGEPLAITGPDGRYELAGLADGTHWVAEQLRPGWTPTFPDNPGPGFQGAEFRVNASGGISTAISAASSNSGSSVIVWSDYGGDGSGSGVLAQFYHADGTARGGPVRVNTFASGDQNAPSLAMDDAGRSVVVWQSQDQDGSDWGIYGQRFHGDGTPDGAEFRINTFTDNSQIQPHVAMNSSGQFVVAWTSYAQASSYAQIYAQRYLPDGTADGEEFRVSTFSGGSQGDPCLTMTDAGDFIVAWSANVQDGSNEGIIARVYRGDGTPVINEFVVNTYTTGQQEFPVIASNELGDFVVVWQSEQQDSSGYGVFGQRFGADGTPAGGEFQVNTYTSDDQRYPSVAMNGLGHFIVAWQSFGQDGDREGIYAQMYDADGLPDGAEFGVNSYTTHQQVRPAVAMNESGSFLVAWADAGQWANQARRYESAGGYEVVLAAGQVVENLDFGNHVHLDFGDAPDPGYPTLAASNGARHVVFDGGPLLGSRVDAEPDGQPTAAADGDDVLNTSDDEDGVIFSGPLQPGDPAASVEVDLTGSPVSGLLSAWIDFNGDGDWADADEQIFSDVPLGAGSVHRPTFAVSTTAVPGPTYARFRISTQAELSWEGLALDGEVEDYRVVLGHQGEIHGHKWHDLDGDGIWGSGEPALSGWPIYLDLNGNGRWDEGEPLQETDAQGRYAFTGLAPGAHLVAEVVRHGWDQTFPAVGSGTGSVTHLTVNSDPEGDLPREVIFTPDGQSVLVVHRDTNNLVIFDAASRNVTATIPVGDYPVDVAVSPDGRYAVVPNLYGDSVSIVDLDDHSVSHVPIAGTLPYDVQVTADGAHAVVGVINDAVNSSFSVISLSTLAEVRSFPSVPQGALGWTYSSRADKHKNLFTQFAVSPDNTTIVLPDAWNSQVVLYDLNKGLPSATLATSADPRAVDISRDGTMAVLGHGPSAAAITALDLVTRTVAGTYSVVNGSGQLVRITSDNSHAIVSAGNDVVFVDLATGQTTSTLLSGVVGDIELSFDGKYAFVSNALGTVIDVASQTIVATVPWRAAGEAATSPVDYRAVALNNLSGDHIHFYHIDGTASVLEGSVLSGELPEGDGPSAVAIAGAGSSAVVGNRNSGNVSVIDLATRSVRAYIDTGIEVRGVAATPDGRYVVVTNGDSNTVSVVDLATDTVVATLPADERPDAVLISPDGQTAYVGSVKGVDRLYFIQLAGAASSVVGFLEPGNIGPMALTADGATLGIYNHYDGRFVLIDTATRTIIAQVALPADDDGAIAFSPDGSRAYVTNAASGRVLVVAVDGLASRLEAIIPGIAWARGVSVGAGGEFVYVGGVFGPEQFPAVYVIHAATNSLVQTVPLGSTAMYAYAAHLSQADSVLYVTASQATLTYWHTGSVWDRRQVLYRVNAAGAASSLIDATPLTSTPSGIAFSESLKTAVATMLVADGVDIVDFNGSRTDGIHSVHLDAGQVMTGMDFGNRALPGLILGSVWHDLDENGDWDRAAEPPLRGWTIYLDLNGNSQWDEGLEPSAVTDGRGNFSFQNLPAGEYTVVQVPNSGWQQTFPFAAGSGGKHQLTIQPGEVSSGNLFGNFALPAEIRGNLWNDHHADSQWERLDEPGLEGWKVYLDLNLNGQFDEGLEPLQITGADGSYAFTGLAAGTYTVAEVMQDGWEQTFPGPGGQVLEAGLTGAGTPYGDQAAELARQLVTTASPVPIYTTDGTVAAAGDGEAILPQTDESGSLINLDAFRADPRFARIDGRGYAVVVLDTGINLSHPFFGDRIVYGWDFADGDPDASDVNGHGSNVTSIIASQDTNYPGVAPGVNIIHLKVFKNSGEGNFAYLEQALQWVVANAASYNIVAVNMSLGDAQNHSTAQTLYGIDDELAALAALDILAVSASGNSFYSFSSATGVAYPSADPNSLSVGAVYDADIGPASYASGAIAHSTAPDRIAPFSQRHSVLSDIFAPGAAITGASHNGSSTVTMHGTSQASPHVAGAAVLAQQLAFERLGRRLTFSEFLNLLQSSGVLVNDGDDEDDNVTNTGRNFPRLDVLALGEAILAMPGTDFVHRITVSAGQVVEEINFGNRVPDEIVVTTTLDLDLSPTDGEISLREALILASNTPNDVTIVLGPGTYTLTRHGADEDAAQTGDLDILPGGSVTIVGAGAGLTIIDALGQLADRVFHVLDGAELHLEALTVTGGNALGHGGGIFNQGTLSLLENIVSGNVSDYGGAISHASGGTLRIERSTLAGNTANYGGAIQTNAPLAVINSTLSGNEAHSSGGAIHNQNALTVYHSTIHGNRANSGGTTGGSGGGISNSTGTIGLYHTIVAGNLVGTGDTPQEISGLVESTSAFNLIADAGSSGGLTHGTNGNIVGNGGTGTIGAGDILSPTLADYGGPTLTHALIPSSPAIDAGNPDFDPAGFDPPLLTDQRGEGFARVLQDRIDIGAFEFLLPYVEVAVAVGSSINPSIYGESVFFTATVSANTGTPSGTIQFVVGGTDLGTPVPLVDGVAQSLAVSDLTATTHTITAQYVPQLASPFVTSSGQLAGGQLVNPKALTVSGITAADKVYDGTTQAVLDVSGVVLVGRIGDDDVVLDASSAAGAFEDPEVGANKTVFVSGLVITGDDTGNYSLVQPTTTASILASAAARIDMTIVREPTAIDSKGEVAILLDSAVWVHEWQTFWVELWVSTPDTTTLGVAEAMVDLAYDTNYLTAQEIVYGPAFLQAQTGTIDDVAGRISEIGARTASTDVGDDAHVLLARVRFTSTGNDQLPVDEAGRSIGPYDMQMALSGGQTVLFGGGVVETHLGQSPSTELWAVVYDIDDNNQIDFGDHSFFAAAFGRTVGDPGFEPPHVWWADFDKSGRVDFGDLAFFAPNFNKSRSAVQAGEKTLIFPSSFPDAWRAGTGGGEGEGKSESECGGVGKGKATSHQPVWAPSASGVRVAASSGGSQDSLALPWQLALAVDQAHAALQTEPTQGFPGPIAAAQEAQPALPLGQESFGSLPSQGDEPKATFDERLDRQFEDWEPLEDLLFLLAVH